MSVSCFDARDSFNVGDFNAKIIDVVFMGIIGRVNGNSEQLIELYAEEGLVTGIPGLE